MKVVVVIFLVAVPLVAGAQVASIAGFASDGLLTWSTDSTNVVCRLDWNIDLAWSWMPILTDIDATSDVNTVAIPLDAFRNLETPFPEVNRRMHTQFFRIVCSTSPLYRVMVTNRVRVMNAGTSDLMDVSFSLGDDFHRVAVTNLDDLGAGEMTPYITLQTPYSAWDDWFVNYTHDGVPREAAMSMLLIGPFPKHATLTVSNDCYLIDLEWLNWQGKIEY